MKISIFHISTVFPNYIQFKSNLKNGEILGETYFRMFLQTVCRIYAYDMALESYGKCTTFLYRNVFLISYGLNSNSNTVKLWAKRIFAIFCKRFVGLRQMIQRWKAMENAQLFRIEIFS